MKTARTMLALAFLLTGCGSSYYVRSSGSAALDEEQYRDAREAWSGESVTVTLLSNEEVSGELLWLDQDSVVVSKAESRVAIPISVVRTVQHSNRGKGLLHGLIAGGAIGAALFGVAGAKDDPPVEPSLGSWLFTHGSNSEDTWQIPEWAAGLIGGAMLGAGIGATVGADDRIDFSSHTANAYGWAGTPDESDEASDSVWLQIPRDHVETDSSFTFTWNGRDRTMSKSGLRIQRSPEWIRMRVARVWMEDDR
jgi:hypothetical protein